MNILTISTSDLYGGAAIASYRLHQALKREGHVSRMLVGYRASDDPDVAQLPHPGKINQWVEKLSTRVGLPYTTIRPTFGIPREQWFEEADVLCLHNLHGRYFNFLALPRLLAAKPAVTTLHDMWLFTNGNPFDTRFMVDPSGADGGGLQWRLKRRVFSQCSMVVATPSGWMAGLARRSILGRYPVHHVPLGLDLGVFRPCDREHARARWSLPADRTVLMAMAETLTDPRKGIDLLRDALRQLPAGVRRRCVLLSVGHHAATALQDVGMDVIDVGYLDDEQDKAVAFSAADLLIFPTRADNMPLVILEAMACGTPAVSFDVGGVREMVRKGETGLLARAEDAGDLGARIQEAVELPELTGEMRRRCRVIAEIEYSDRLQVSRYVELFDEAATTSKKVTPCSGPR